MDPSSFVRRAGRQVNHSAKKKTVHLVGSLAFVIEDFYEHARQRSFRGQCERLDDSFALDSHRRIARHSKSFYSIQKRFDV